jgi:hypothetical protein
MADAKDSGDSSAVGHNRVGCGSRAEADRASAHL